MSKKPVKKSDENKEWLQKRKDKVIKSQLEYHLIICEGTKTEPNYFESIKSKIVGKEQNKIMIDVIGKGRGTTNLLKEAVKRVNLSTNYISNVWLIYDKDSFTDESFNDVVTKCAQMNAGGNTQYNAIWSNECIELWILLHFIRFDSKIGRNDYIKKINENFKKKKLGVYEKNSEDLYDKIKPYLTDAISNAKWLEDKYANMNLNPSEMNPCTKVYKLVELLHKYI